MDILLIKGLVVASALLNIVLWFRVRVWKNRTYEYGDLIGTINNRCKLAFTMLLNVAEERGIDQKEFNIKMVALSQIPEEMRDESMYEKVLPPAKAKSDNHIGFN